MEFKVKRDFLLVFLVNLALAFLLGVSLYFIYNVVVFIIALAIVLALIALYNTAVIFTGCSLGEENLVFKTGAFKYDIKIAEIQKVTKERNYYGSLSLSADRIRILTKNAEGKLKVYYISVVDNDKLFSILNEKTAPKPTTKEEVKPAKKAPASKPKAIKKPADKNTKK